MPRRQRALLKSEIQSLAIIVAPTSGLRFKAGDLLRVDVDFGRRPKLPTLWCFFTNPRRDSGYRRPCGYLQHRAAELVMAHKILFLEVNRVRTPEWGGFATAYPVLPPETPHEPRPPTTSRRSGKSASPGRP